MIKSIPNIPDNWKILNGTMLKLFACAFMLIDHIAKFLLYRNNELYFNVSLETIQSLVMIGRLAFPIFAFLLTEGYIHTHNKMKYALNLLLFGIISEIPFDLMLYGSISFTSQNVMFTLLIGFLGIWSLDFFKDNIFFRIGSIAILALVTHFCKVDYGAAGFAFILLMYALRNEKALQSVICSIVIPSSVMVFISFGLIYMYNGQRGTKSKIAKYAFYSFYPIHMLAIYLTAYLIL